MRLLLPNRPGKRKKDTDRARQVSLACLKLCVSAVLLLTTASAQVDQGWTKFEPEGAGFSVKVPAQPVEQPSSKKALRLFSVTSGRMILAISYGDRSPGKTLNTQKVLEATRDSFNKQFNAKLLTSRELTLDSWPGLEFTSESPAANIKSRVFLVGNREYQIVGLVFKDAEMTASVNAFLESFAFTSK